jgi:predicted dehydrogenase
MSSPPKSPINSSPNVSANSTFAPAALETGRLSGVGTRVRVGLIGLDRAGEFHAEQLSLRPEFEIMAGCEPTGNGPRRLPGPCATDRPVYSRIEDLLAGGDLVTVLIAGPTEHRAEWALRALEARIHVALDPPPCANAAEMRELRAAASRSGRCLWILPTRRRGTEFQTALQIARGQQLGSLYSARLLSWGRAVPHTTRGSRPSMRAAEPEVDAFDFFAYQYVDQLLQLIRRPSRSVFARIAFPSTNDLAATAFTLAIGFERGINALIDVNLASGALLHTSWVLAGDQGGYSAGRIYLHDSSGEISDAPVSQTDLPALDVYGELLAAAPGETSTTASAADAETVMRVIDAARESAQSGQSVGLDS